MKQAKQRIVAIDYFRGICILVVLMNHAAVFTMPFTYLAGNGQLWTSAAEMFLILSGTLFGIVRGDQIKNDFRAVVKKTWTRALRLYVLNVMIVMISLIIAIFCVSHRLADNVAGALPAGSAVSTIRDIFLLRYSIGWASFLVVYPVFLAFAPFALYILKTRFWALLPAGSVTLFLFNSSLMMPEAKITIVTLLSMWQLYFVMGLVIERFRPAAVCWFHGLKQRSARLLADSVLALSAGVLGLSIALNFNLYPTVLRLTASGWLPLKAPHLYMHALHHKPIFDNLLMSARTGVLRPAIALLFLAAGWLLYDKHRDFLLKKTGRFVNALGRDTLWIFMGQALAIPVLAAIPMPRNLLGDSFMTVCLITSMWLLTQRGRLAPWYRAYSAELRDSFYQAKYDGLFRRQIND